jgi:DNA-binding LacI/PurR family transcriptional regulator
MEYLECQITTLVQPVEEMCSTALRFLMQRIEGEATSKPQKIKLKPKLVIRDSSIRRA